MNTYQASKKLKKIFILLMVISLFQVTLPLSFSEEEEHEITIGVLSFSSKEATLEKWQPLADYLTITVDGQHFSILPLFYDDFENAIENKSVDYILTNPAHFISLGQSYEISGAIATLTELVNNKPQSGFGGVIFTKYDNGDIMALKDLKGKTISAVSGSSLGGYQASAYELIKIGINLDRDINFEYTGMPHANTIQMVLDGQADAGFVRSGVIESQIASGHLAPDALKILNSQSLENFEQELSTVLYPEWPFVALSHIQPGEAQKVAASLYLIDTYPRFTELIGIYGFTIPSSYLDVELLMRELKIPPFDYEEPISLYRIWQQYNYQIVISFGLLMLIIYYAINKARTGRLLTAKNMELSILTRQLRKTNDELKEISEKDVLTGLYNRRYFEVFLEEKLHHVERYRKSLAICVIDIDDFKIYNDTYGHDVGDLVLKEVANTLQDQVQRSLDLVARYAGDEFIIILYDINHKGLHLVADKIINAINDLAIRVPEKGDIISVSISMGITTTSPNCHKSSSEIFRVADNALFEVKDMGKNQYLIKACDCCEEEA